MKELLLESRLVLLSIGLGFIAPRLGSPLFLWFEGLFSGLALRKRVAVLAVTLGALLAGAVPALLDGFPRPEIPDEFSYLLAADTFAHGRLTNPTHPLWEHFESFHINQQPTYMSIYPPGQGLVMAAGQLLAGHPWFGVWFSAALMCGAICWMLQAWLPPGWALFGGFLAITRLATFSYWTQSYWGGAVAAMGGALMLGAVRRLMARPRWTTAFLFAMGLVIVANTRPFEGLVLTVAIAGAWAVQRFKAASPAPLGPIARASAPAICLLMLAGCAMLYYNWRETGGMFRLPYVVNQAQYRVAPEFIFQKPYPIPAYRHKALRDYYVGSHMKDFETLGGWKGLEPGFYARLAKSWIFYFGPVLTIGLFPLKRALTDRRIRLLAIAAAVSAVLLSMSAAFYPHYAAPYTALAYAIVLQGLRHVRLWRFRGRPIGLLFTRAIPVICLAMIAVRAATGPPPPFGALSWCANLRYDSGRQTLLRKLDADGGRHLIIVRYGADHDPHEEWVYNAADIDAARVVWAREMDDERNARLINYFQDRQVWLFEPERNRLELKPYAKP